MYPFERFTERAKRVLTLAQEEAERAHRSYIGTEHLLLGLMREQDGLAFRVLSNLGVEIDRVRETIESVVGADSRSVAKQIIPTSRVKKVIEISFEEARRMRHNFVGTEHLLVALLVEGENVAGHALQDLGANLERVRGETERLLADASPLAPEGERSSAPYEIGQRVLVHDSDPPHRLWEGRVTAADGARYRVAIPGHVSGDEVTADERFIHPIPMMWTRGCPFCLG